VFKKIILYLKEILSNTIKQTKNSRPDFKLSRDLSSLEMVNIYIYTLDKKTVVDKKPTAPLVFK